MYKLKPLDVWYDIPESKVRWALTIWIFTSCVPVNTVVPIMLQELYVPNRFGQLAQNWNAGFSTHSIFEGTTMMSWSTGNVSSIQVKCIYKLELWILILVHPLIIWHSQMKRRWETRVLASSWTIRSYKESTFLWLVRYNYRSQTRGSACLPCLHTLLRRSTKNGAELQASGWSRCRRYTWKHFPHVAIMLMSVVHSLSTMENPERGELDLEIIGCLLENIVMDRDCWRQRGERSGGR